MKWESPKYGNIRLDFETSTNPDRILISLQQSNSTRHINSHQYETAVRGMGHRDTGNHLGTIVSCDNYPFCACDLE